MTLYGIGNCDTVRRAWAWLSGQGVEYRFHDFKKLGVPSAQLDRWLATAGWQSVLNRQGTTWRKLPQATRDAVGDAAGARAVMLAQASVIKRPVIEWPSGQVTVGFDAADWTRRLQKPGDTG